MLSTLLSFISKTADKVLGNVEVAFFSNQCLQRWLTHSKVFNEATALMLVPARLSTACVCRVCS